MNLIFLSDTIELDGFGRKDKFLEYMKLDSTIKSYGFYNKLNILTEIPDNKYIVFYDTFDGLSSLKNLSNKILSDLKNNKCYVIFFQTDCCGWGYTTEDSYWIEFNNFLKNNNISKNNFGFVFHETVLNSEKTKVNKLGIDFMFHNRNALYSYFPDNWAFDDNVDKTTLFKIFKNTRGYYRQFKYCSHNNNFKEHRIELLMFLIKNNLLNDGITTWFGGQEPIDQGIKYVDFFKFNSFGNIVDYSEEYGKDVVNFANNFVPNSYDLKINGLQDYLNVIPYFNSYFNIITESTWGPGYDNTHPQKIHITEKIWKSIVTYNPFIVISSQNTLKKLKEWGFETFENWIDETYDDSENYEDRKRIINKEIIRLSSMTTKELDTLYWEMEEVLIHNSNNYIEFINNEYDKLKNFIRHGLEK